MCTSAGGFLDRHNRLILLGIDRDFDAESAGVFELAIIDIHRAHV